MSRPMISFVDNEMLEKIYEKRKRDDGKVKCGIDSYDEEVYSDEEIFPLTLDDFEERLGKGFKMFSMAKNGYPLDG